MKKKNSTFLNIKETIKNYCPPFLWIYLSNLKHKTIKYKYKSLDNIDKKIESYLNFNNGYFVELGANDGVTFSNSYYFEKQRGWKGILVEPVPHNYLRCCANRSKKTKVYCNACVSFGYKEKFVEMIYSDLMSQSLGLESDINNPKKHALMGKQFLKPMEKNFKFAAIADQLNNILKKANAPKQIDFMSLDVEGAEIEVLKGVNHNEYRFKFICIESRSIEKITNYLSTKNYLMIEKLSHLDYLFKDKKLKK